MADVPPAPIPTEVPWLRIFPWLRLFRCPGAAADAKRLMLAALGLIALHVGWRGVDRLLPPPGEAVPGVVWSAWPGRMREPLLDAPARVSEPVRLLSAPFLRVFDTAADRWALARAALQAVWAVAVWGLVGGAIARAAVVGLTRSERVGLAEALRFSARKSGTLVGTPLIPVVGVAMIAALVAAFGLLYRLPGQAGVTLAGVLAFLPLVGGLVLTLILIGLAFGWPLMHASVAAEAEDGFDAMSRSYAYVHQRPWHYAAYVALAAALGCVGFVFVTLFARLVVHLAAWSLTLSAPAETVAALYSAGSAPPIEASFASAAHGFWLRVVLLLVQAWVYSYFWTAATAIYLLLRRDIDGTPWGTVAYQSRRGPLDVAATTEGGAPTVPAPHETGVRDAGEVAEA